MNNQPMQFVENGNADVAADLTKKFLKGEPLPASNIKLSETFYGTQSSK